MEINPVEQVSSNKMIDGIKRAKTRNLLPNTIIDVGAAQGIWSLDAHELWPNSEFLLFEPLIERKLVLDEIANQFQNFKIVNKGAGNKAGLIDFFVTEDLDGSGIADNGTNAKKVQIEVTTIDFEVKRLQLKPPFLLKLDTHGYEVPIIEGANETLKRTCLIIIECYGYQIAPESLLFWEMCQHMINKGFRLVDIVDVSNRPKDFTFWQCDAFFIPATESNFKYNTYNY